MTNITGTGIFIYVTASQSFPSGFIVSQFTDDADPIDIEDLTIADAAMGLNGNLIVWSKAVPIKLSFNVIPDSDDDQNLEIIADNNRVGANKTSVGDVINLVVTYPDGATTSYTSGIMLVAPAGTGVASSGRMKTKKYSFAFEGKA